MWYVRNLSKCPGEERSSINVCRCWLWFKYDKVPDLVMDPNDWHPQDWIIVIEALSLWASSLNSYQSSKQIRAEEMMIKIGLQHGLYPQDLLFQVNEEWFGTLPLHPQ